MKTVIAKFPLNPKADDETYGKPESKSENIDK
jgi:hypothetical protein